MRNIRIRKQIQKVLASGDQLTTSQILDGIMNIRTITSSNNGKVISSRRSKACPPTLRQLSAILPVEASKVGFDPEVKQMVWQLKEVNK